MRKPSTYYVTLIRLSLILLPSLISSTTSIIYSRATGGWLYNPSFLTILIRPHKSLAYLEEAHAVQILSKSDYFSSFYLTNDSVRIPPLVLVLLSPLMETSNPGLWLSMLLLLVDFFISYMLEKIGIQLLLRKSRTPSDDSIGSQPRPIGEDDLQRKLPDIIRPQNEHIFPIYRSDSDSASTFDGSSKEESNTRKPEPLINMRSIPLLSAQLYYWSPFTFLPTGLFYCWQNIASFFLVASVYESSCYSSSGSLSMASFYLAAATYIEPHHLVYLVPIILMLNVNDFSKTSSISTSASKSNTRIIKSAIYVLILFAVWSLCLQGISYSLVGSKNYWKVLQAVYGNTWLTSGPNLSLQWYFRMQIFSRFRAYFGTMFALFPCVLVGPICLRFIRYPGVQLAALSMLWTIYRPEQVLYDANLAFCFFLFSPQSLARMGFPAFIAMCCLIVPVLLYIVDRWMWLDCNNGNANYMFFQCLAYNTFLAIILGQFISASMQRDKALRLTYEKEVRRDRIES